MKHSIVFRLLIIFILFLSGQFIIYANGIEESIVLELQQAIKRALAVDLSLKAAKLNLEIAKKDFESVKRTLSIGGSYLIINSDPGGWQILDRMMGTNSGGAYDRTTDHIYSKWFIEYQSIDEDNNSYNLSYSPFNLEYEKYIKTMELNYISWNLNYQNTRNKLVMDVRNAYAEAVQKEELYKLALQDLELFQNQYKRRVNLFDSGKISRLDLMDAEQQLKAAEVKLNSAVLKYQAGLLKLSTLLQKEDLKSVILERSTIEGEAIGKVDLQTTLDRCLKDSLDVRAAAVKIQVEKVQKMMDSFYLLKNVYICAGQNRKDGFEARYYGFGFKGSLDDSYFRDYRASAKKLEVAQINMDVVTRNKRMQILEAYRNWEISELSLIPKQQILDIAKERYKIASQKYEKGMASGSELDQAYLTVNRAAEDYWSTWLSRQYSRELFYQAVDGEPVLKAE